MGTEFRPLQVPRRVHAIMKHANDRDPVVRDTEVNHMPLDIAAAIPLTNILTSLSGLRRIGRHLKCSREQVGVPLGLLKSPLYARVFPNTFKVALSGGRESVLSHARGEACA